MLPIPGIGSSTQRSLGSALLTGEGAVSGQKLDELNGSRVTAVKVMKHKNQGSSLSQLKEDFT